MSANLELSPAQIRVLGSLLEKQRTTPDAYPLSLNSLRLACNQATNRDPVVEYDEATIREALERLQRRGLTRLASGAGSRAAKYRHLLAEALPMDRSEEAVMCVLMLRGPQTPGELKQRGERMHPFADLGAVLDTLQRLTERGLARSLGRRPGQKEERYTHLLGAEADEAESAPRAVAELSPADLHASAPAQASASLEARVAALEREVAELRERAGAIASGTNGGERSVGAHLALLASASDTATGVGIPVAVAAGLVSFLSPCVLPLVPGYLSAVIGVTPHDLQEGVGVRRVLVPSLLFILSFSAIFILLGLSATVIGHSLNSHKHALEQVGGYLIIAMGVVFLATPFIGMLNKEWHSETLLRLAGRGGPLLAGAAFAIAWTPCTSITLGAILTQAAISSSAAHGALLLAFYSLGLAIPFLLIAVAFDRMTNALAIVKRHFPVIIGIGGLVMIVLGVLIVTGEFTILNNKAQQLTSELGLPSTNV